MAKYKENKEELIRNLLPFLFLAIVLAVFGFISGGRLFSSKSIIGDLFTMLVGTTGMVFVLSQGCLDFSVASNVAMSCIVAAWFSKISPGLALPAGILTGCLIGTVVGIIHACLKVNSFIASLSVSFILTGMVENILHNGSLSCPFSMLKWNTTELKIIVGIVVLVLGFIAFEKTRIGKEGKIVGSNEEYARQIGIRVRWVKIRGFIIMGAVCGLVAFFILIKSGTASTSTGGGFQVSTLNALLIGGMSITGGASSRFRQAIIGSLILAFLSLGMSLANISSLDQQIVEGAVYLVAILMTFNRAGVITVK